MEKERGGSVQLKLFTLFLRAGKTQKRGGKILLHKDLLFMFT